VLGQCKCVILHIVNIETIAENNIAVGATTEFTDTALKRFKCANLHANTLKLSSAFLCLHCYL
jgi:hypothetical protein